MRLGPDVQLGRTYALLLENIVKAGSSSTDPMMGVDLSASSAYSADQAEAAPSTLDVSRYWAEIWGNELVPAEVHSGGWEQIFNHLINANMHDA